MPYRKTPLSQGEIYHIFNRSVARQPIFLGNRDYQRALETIRFYLFSGAHLSFSHYDRLPLQQRSDFMKKLEESNERQIEIFAYCLMPNHLHFLMKCLRDKGISNFMNWLQNSYAKYFNIKTERSGALFQSMFKAVRIESDEQFIHVGRYIHLNPLTAYIIKNSAQLENYPWSSFAEYLDNQDPKIISRELMLGHFSSVEAFKRFTFDQIDYQRKLAEIKHLLNE
ncbi:transposase [Candidatus Daviesbacteria bacterium]|nr:transposase [Candidatus Daviesbacteria bacterium]